MLTRRALFGLLPAVAVAAQPGVEAFYWPYETVDEKDNLTSRGLQVEASCPASNVAAFEITVSWRHDFLGKGAVQSVTQVVSAEQPYCSVETGGYESWVKLEVTALTRSSMRTAYEVPTTRGE